MRAITAFPLMIIAVIAYNAMVFSQGFDLLADVYVGEMMSGSVFAVNTGDMFIIVSLVLLFLEILKASRIGTVTIVDHVLSTGVFIIALVEFLLVARCGTSTFFIIMLMCLIDVVGGYSISIRSARRDVSFGGGV